MDFDRLTNEKLQTNAFDQWKDDEEEFERDYRLACKWAWELTQQPDKWLILDTETTGLDVSTAEIVQLALLRPDSSTLFETLLKPDGPISDGAARVHGLTAQRLKDAPGFVQIYPKLLEVLAGDLVIVCYNVGYDRPILFNACARAGLVTPANEWECAMEWYSKFVGDWNSYHQSYRWQRLPGGDHSAAGDCRATLRLIKKMAEAHHKQ
jgi:DNA polymerase-3 subunit epsilon